MVSILCNDEVLAETKFLKELFNGSLLDSDVVLSSAKLCNDKVLAETKFLKELFNGSLSYADVVLSSAKLCNDEVLAETKFLKELFNGSLSYADVVLSSLTAKPCGKIGRLSVAAILARVQIKLKISSENRSPFSCCDFYGSLSYADVVFD